MDDGLARHRLWVINDRLTIKAIRDDFKDRKLYIADGHHRYETSINYRNYMREKGVYDPDNEYVMMYLADMADDGLVVFPTHRMVRGLENFDSKNLLEKCSEYFETEEIEGDIEDRLEEKAAEGKIAFVYYDGSGRYLLTLKSKDIMAQIIPDMSDDYRMLDVSVLHSLILERIFKIDKENMANQKNLTYTRSVEEAMGSVDNGESNCAFFLNPTAVSEIGAVAQNGEKMPQKSTYFYPKLLTGLVMNNMGDK